VTKQKTILIIVIAILFFSLSLYLYLGNRTEPLDEDVEVGSRVYRNENLSYEMNYPASWEIREKRSLTSFYSNIRSEDNPQTTIDLKTYDQIFGVDLVGTSPLTYIDGVINYNIEKNVYQNSSNLTVRQWYDIAVLLEAYSTQKLTETDFIKISSKVLKGEEILKERIYDPWTPEGEIIKIGNKDVLKTTRLGDNRYDGYQYYITALGEYIFVFYFGYGGLVIPREMWQRSDNHVRGIIWSLNIF
jgi:hypothetical protein